MNIAAWLIALGFFLAVPAGAQQVPNPMSKDGANAQLPQALNNLAANTTAHTYYAQAYGSCAWTAVGDTEPCISAAIAAAKAAGGGIVVLPSGISGIASTIAQTGLTGITLAGAGGSANYDSCPTRLKWIGAVDGVMVRFGSDSVADNIVGGGLSGVCLDGGGIAGTGVMIRSLSNGVFQYSAVRDVKARGWDIGPGPGVVGTSLNYFLFTSAILNSAAAINAVGYYLGGGDSGNSHHNHFFAPRVLHQSGTGFVVANADSNVVYDYYGQSGTGLSLEFLGSNTSSAGVARSNKFYYAEPQGGTTARGVTSYTYASRNNNIEVNMESGAPSPVVEAGATLFCSRQLGSAAVCSPQILAVNRKFLNTRGASISLTADESSKFVNNNNAGGVVTYTLPAAAGLGTWYCFQRYGFGMTIQAVAPDVITLGVTASAAGGTVSSTAQGSSLCLVDGKTANWVAFASNNAWVTP